MRGATVTFLSDKSRTAQDIEWLLPFKHTETSYLSDSRGDKSRAKKAFNPGGNADAAVKKALTLPWVPRRLRLNSIEPFRAGLNVCLSYLEWTQASG